ncbi:MAG: PIG-L family deacetylase, partial [Chloroflexota bacterium]|nr:PIG-L family deacetylase [Chloroflexota bacterium]
GGLEDTREFRGQLVEAIRRFKPDVVLTTEPYHRLQHAHRDHRMIGVVAQDACFPYARDIHHFPEHRAAGLEPHKVGVILFWGSEDPDVFCDVTETVDQKIEALAKHASQFGGRNPGDFSRARVKQNGERVGVEYAEIFRRVTFRR